jgi:uridylate kinase
MMYKRALLKISGEAFSGSRGFGVDPAKMAWIANQVALCSAQGCELGIVVGGGNIVRGVDSASVGVPPLDGDHLGMISTVINGVAFRYALQQKGVRARVLSSFSVGQFVEVFSLEKSLDYISSGETVIFVGGTGNPCFTTDSAAALRAVQIGANIMIKATQVDGVFDRDPRKYPDAVFFETISRQEVLRRELGVIDAAAMDILGRNGIPTVVVNLHVEGNVAAVLAGKHVGTIIPA